MMFQHGYAYGMGGMMSFGLIIPLLVLVLLVLGIASLIKYLRQH